MFQKCVSGQLENITNNNGFLLFELGETKIQISQNIHYYNYNITPIYEEFIKITKFKNNIIEQTKNNKHFETLTNLLNYSYNDLNEQIGKLFNKRSKRGILNGLGSIVKTISGNLDASDGERYDRLFEQIKINENKLQNQNEQIIKYSEEMVSKFNEQLNNIKHNEIQIMKEINIIKDIAKKNSNWQGLMEIESKFNKIIHITNNLNNFCKNIETSLTFCSMHKLHSSIIKIKDLQAITNNEDIFQINEFIMTYCHKSNDQIIFLIEIPIFSQNEFPIYQFTPIPFLDQNNNLIVLEKESLLYFKNDDNKYVVSSFKKIDNKYFSVTNYISVDQCINNLIEGNINDCHFLQLTKRNDLYQISNTNKLIIISPFEQNININCLNKNVIKNIQGIFIIEINSNCFINNLQFKNIHDNFKEIQFDDLQITQHNKIFNKTTYKDLQLINVSKPIFEKIQPIIDTKSDNYNNYITYVLISAIFLILIIKYIVKGNLITKCKNTKVQNNDVELGTLK